jgi:hypothetical protein
MKSIFGTSLVLAALSGVALLVPPAHAADTSPNSQAAAPSPTPEVFIVTAKALADLRMRVKVAEDTVYSRFNEINGDDRFDIRCEPQLLAGSHIEGPRACMSNGERDAESGYARATLAQILGGYGSDSGHFLAQMSLERKALSAEMRRVAHEDPELQQQLVRLGQTYLALELVTGSGPAHTLYREIPAGEDGLPFDARRMVDVRIGQVPWTSPLTHRTFTLAGLTGRVRNLSLDCDKAGTKTLSFKDDQEWTLPDSWGACTLTVAAKRDTTFRLVEFN